MNPESDNSLVSPDPESLEAFRQKKSEIIDETVKRVLKFQDEVAQHGEQASNTIGAGLGFVLSAVDTAMEFNDTKLLEHQISWGSDRLQHYQVQPEHVLHRFEVMREVVSEKLEKTDAAAVNQYLDFLIAGQQEGMVVNDSEE